MFRRLTDDLVCKRLGRRPLDVGADRIARTAHWALRFLEELRVTLTTPIYLAWAPAWETAVRAIEVYPAATRISLAAPPGRGSLAGLQHRIHFSEGSPPESEHARDAVVCALAALEFLAGRAIPPAPQQETDARREGWIWVGSAPGDKMQPGS